ncbi:hypothetical protein, partial [Alloalcanivorax venustensis]|uniref:hypothetical protein n=1 Tax=Alloalcanivorax venustensis TaxID=172371 RepID=UPI003C335803
MGFRRGRYNACVFTRPARGIRCIFHGDDFLAEGHHSSLDKLDTVLEQFEVKKNPRLGPTGARSGVIL